MTVRRSRSYARALLVAAVVMVAAGGSTDATGAAPRAPSFVPGSAAASSSIAGARLFYGGLSLPLGVGTTAASYTNNQSRALGVALDLGTYISLVTDTPPQFTPTVIDSNAGDREVSADVGAGEAIGRVDLRATQVPASSSEARMADVSLPALVHVEGAYSHASTEVADGRQRRASSTVGISRVSIAGGLVLLEDLRWEARQTSGFEPGQDAEFTIGRARIAGLPVLIPAGGLPDALGPVNAALLPVGLRIEAPTSSSTPDGAATITPLRVMMADSELGAQLLGPIIASARPLLAPAFEAMTDIDSALGLVGLVADLALGVADGSGGIEVTIGGATATTSERGFVAPARPQLPTPASDTHDAVTAEPRPAPRSEIAAKPPTPPDPATPVSVDAEVASAPTVASTSLRCVLEAAPLRRGECRDSNVLLAIGISGLAVTVITVMEIGMRRRRPRRPVVLR